MTFPPFGRHTTTTTTAAITQRLDLRTTTASAWRDWPEQFSKWAKDELFLLENLVAARQRELTT